MALPLPYRTVEFEPMALLHTESASPFGRSVTIDKAAELLSVSRRTIYNRIKDGRLRTIRTANGSSRVLMESLYELGFRPLPFPTSASAATFSVRSLSR